MVLHFRKKSTRDGIVHIKSFVMHNERKIARKKAGNLKVFSSYGCKSQRKTFK